jgi:hypothetical protein
MKNGLKESVKKDLVCVFINEFWSVDKIDALCGKWANKIIKELKEHMHSNRPPSYKALQQDGYDLAVGQMLKFLKGSDGYRRLLDEMK